MKLHKVVLYVIDFDELSDEGFKDEIEFRIDGITRIANHEVADIGEFEDEHELNQNSATVADFEKYFK